jgi:hypothetical protein
MAQEQVTLRQGPQSEFEPRIKRPIIEHVVAHSNGVNPFDLVFAFGVWQVLRGTLSPDRPEGRINA